MCVKRAVSKSLCFFDDLKFRYSVGDFALHLYNAASFSYNIDILLREVGYGISA